MSASTVPRRDILKSILGALPVALDWASFPVAKADHSDPDAFDAVIIGAGLGGLSCAAGFARQGFRALVVEQHNKPGGYATAFKRPGGFEFDVSLHTTYAGERNGIHNLIPGLPEITEVEFVPLPSVYRAMFPNHHIRVPRESFGAYLDALYSQFPDEQQGIKALYDDMSGLAADVDRFVASGGKLDMKSFATDFPNLIRSAALTWGQMMDAHIRDPKLRAIASALWMYYGLPPSKLAAIYYAYPTIGTLKGGGYYPKNGRSQNISDALVRFIETRGGKVALNTRVESILTQDGAACGVRTADGHAFRSKAVVSNANAYDTFHNMLPADEKLRDYVDRMDRYTPSLSTFQVFLGLKRDLVSQLSSDAEVFLFPGYDTDEMYQAAVAGDVTRCAAGVMIYDTLYSGYSPRGKNTITIVALQGYEPWEKFEADYWSGRKRAYTAEKERMAKKLIERAERAVLPGLSKAIEVREIATPLTNVRYTHNYRGAIYGWEQTLNNSGMRRLPHRTPVKNLYLAGAWTQPGGGYVPAIMSGLQCFREAMKSWT